MSYQGEPAAHTPQAARRNPLTLLGVLRGSAAPGAPGSAPAASPTSATSSLRAPRERYLGPLAALLIFNLVLSASSQEALFLAHHPRAQIPLAMLLGSLVTAATTLCLNRLQQKRSPAVALRAILAVLALCAAVGAVWNLRPGPTSTFALFLFFEMATTLGVAATWTYFQAPLSPAQIRHLMPRLGTWAGVGGLLAGLLIPVLPRLWRVLAEPQALIFLSALSWAVAAALVRLDHVPRIRRASPRSARAASGLRQVFREPLTRWLTLGAAGLIWVGLALQYETRATMQQRLTPESIAWVMGLLLAAASLLGIAVQALLTGRVLERFGVGLALGILPVALAGLLGLYLFLPGLGVGVIAAAFFLDKALRPSLHRPAESCLVAALSPALRPAFSLTLAAILAPLLKAAGALGLLCLSAAGPGWLGLLPRSALWVALGLVGLSTRWGALYARSLRATLLEGSIAGSGDDFSIEVLGDAVVPAIDGPRLGILLESIDGRRPRSRALALELLRPHRSPRVYQAMQARLAHPDQDVRVAALRWLAEQPAAGFLDYLKDRFRQPDLSAHERIVLLEATGRDAAALLGDDLIRWMTAPDLELRTAVLQVVLAHGEPWQREVALRGLALLLRSGQAEEQCAGLQLARHCGDREILPLVLGCLSHPERSVRREAIAALAAFCAEEPARAALWTALADRSTAHAAARALAASGPAILPAVVEQLNQPGTSQDVRLHLLRILGLIPMQPDWRAELALAQLLAHLESPAAALRLEALKSLNRLRRGAAGRRSPWPLPLPLLHHLILRELRFGLRLLQCRDLMKNRLCKNGLLARELSQQIDHVQQRVTQALELLCPAETMVHVFRALRSRTRSAAGREQARELLRALFPDQPVRTGALKLLEEDTPWTDECFRPPLEGSVGHTTLDAARWLHSSGDPWLRAALRHDQGSPSHKHRAFHHAAEDDPMELSLDLILFLKDVALFEALTNQQLVEVARLADPLTLAAGQRLFKQGDPSDALYLVRHGKLRVVIAGQERARLGPGECAGEMGVLAAMERTGTVETVQQSQLLRFDGTEFLALLESYPEIGRGLMKSLVQRLARVGFTRGQRPSTIVGMLEDKSPEDEEDDDDREDAAPDPDGPTDKNSAIE